MATGVNEELDSVVAEQVNSLLLDIGARACRSRWIIDVHPEERHHADMSPTACSNRRSLLVRDESAPDPMPARSDPSSTAIVAIVLKQQLGFGPHFVYYTPQT